MLLLVPFTTAFELIELLLLLSMNRPPTLSKIAFVQGDRPCDKLRAGASVEGADATGANLLRRVSQIAVEEDVKSYYLARFEEAFKS